MKKLLSIALIALMVMANVFAGGSSEAVEATADSPVTLKVANYALLESGYEDFWAGVKEGFEAKYPQYKIEWVTAPYGEILNQVINMAGGGDRVDVIFGEEAWVPQLYASGLAAPVTSIVDEAFVSDFDPAVMDVFTIDGDIYGIPLYVSPFILYYNTELFEQAGLDPANPPKTYDEMLAAAEKLSQLTDANGNKVYAFGQTTASVVVSGNALISMIYNFGGNVFTEDGQLDVDNEGFRQAFEMLQLLDEKGYNPQNAKLKDLRNLFALGQLAMYYDQSWGFNGVSSINPDASSFTASAAPLAGGSGTGEAVLCSHCFIVVDNGEAKNAATDAFVQYVISEEVLSDYLANVTPAYPAKNSMSDMESVVNSGVLKGASSSISNVRKVPYVSAMSDISLDLCTLAQAVTVSNTSVDQAIEAFVRSASVKL